MNLTVEQLVARAQRALETGQPNMAVLYMRKALVILAAERTMPAAQGFLDALVQVTSHLGASVTAFLDEVWQAFTPAPLRSDFALAGPVES